MPANGRPRRPDPAPLEVDAVPVVAIGTALWAVAFVVLLPLKHVLARHDAAWWLWVCVAGFGLGVPGLGIATRRKARLRAASSAQGARRTDQP